MSATRSDGPPRRGRYHHGDLKAALVGAAVELIAERGVRDFSLAEVSRRLGVTVAAPYRHFADRDELLAAVAVAAFGTLSASVAADVIGTDPPDRRLASMAGAYVRFAAANRGLFGVLFGSGIDKERFHEVRQAAEPVSAVLTSCVTVICGDDAAAAAALADAVAAAAHGYATLLLDGTFGDAETAGEVAAEHAMRACLALVAGRAALLSR
ncbi:MAG: TetR/AcrR family transcriptional regulator [Streptosporangiaceae bacterium]